MDDLDELLNNIRIKHKDIPFPECAASCPIPRVFGVSECDSVCPEKDEGGRSK